MNSIQIFYAWLFISGVSFTYLILTERRIKEIKRQRNYWHNLYMQALKSGLFQYPKGHECLGESCEPSMIPEDYQDNDVTLD